jgi:hypothetical protein
MESLYYLFIVYVIIVRFKKSRQTVWYKRVHAVRYTPVKFSLTQARLWDMYIPIRHVQTFPTNSGYCTQQPN